MPRGTTTRICGKCGQIVAAGAYCSHNTEKYAGKPWHEVAARTRRRDDNQCMAAGRQTSPCRGALQVHHLTRVADGGTDAPGNLVTLCAAHHRIAEAAGPDSPLGIELRKHAQRASR